MIHRIAMVAGFALIAASPSTGWTQAPARNGNQSDFNDWQPTRGAVATEEKAAGVSQTPQQRNAEDRELQDLYNKLLHQEQPPSPAQPGTAR